MSDLVAKTLVRNERDEVLVLRRFSGDIHRAGQWDLPGGTAEPNEQALTTALREAKEETGLQLSQLSPVSTLQQTYGTKVVTKQVFTTTHYSGEVTLSWEHDAYQWVTLDELQQLPLSDSYKKAAQILQENLAVAV